MRLGTSDKKLDAAAIRQGVTKECPFREGFTVTILPGASYNPRFRKAIQNATAAITPSHTIADEFTSRYEDPQFIVDALVADMGGIYGEDGEPVAYTPEIGVAILSDPGNADVKEWVVNEAHQYGSYYTKSVEQDAKNSQTGSSGNKAGAGRSGKSQASKG